MCNVSGLCFRLTSVFLWAWVVVVALCHVFFMVMSLLLLCDCWWSGQLTVIMGVVLWCSPLIIFVVVIELCLLSKCFRQRLQHPRL